MFLLKPVHRILFILMIVVANIGCDQVSKSIVRTRLENHENIPLFDHHLLITKVENSGAFLSMGDALPPVFKTVVLSLIPALTLLLMLVWLFRQKGLSNGVLVSLCCIAGGGIGNIFDRVVHGSVTDFLYVSVGMFHTGIFNLADVSITGGTLLLIASQLFKYKN